MIIYILFVQISIYFIMNTYLIGKKALTKFNIIFSTTAVLLLVFLYEIIELYASVIMFLCLIVVNYKNIKDWCESIYTSAITMIIIILSDHITSIVLYSYNLLALPQINILSATLEEIVIHLGSFIVITVLLAKIWSIISNKINVLKDRFKNLKVVVAMFSAFTYLGYSASILIVRNLGNENKMIILNGFFLIIYFLIFLVSLVFLLNYQKKKYEVKKRKLEFENLQIYTDSLEQSYTEIRKFRHDYINILASMSEYIKNKDIEALDTYFNENIMKVSESIKLNNFKLNYLKNIKIPEIKGLLSSKLIIAQEKGIDITFESVDIIYNIYMDRVELCRCLGILLDNAIEEAASISNAKVNVAFINYTNSISFIVMNSYIDKGYKVFKYFEKGFSTKGEKRGLGLSNLKEIIARIPNTQLDTNIENGNFIQEIKIDKKENNQ